MKLDDAFELALGRTYRKVVSGAAFRLVPNPLDAEKLRASADLRTFAEMYLYGIADIAPGLA